MTPVHLVTALRSVVGQRHTENQDAGAHAGDYAFVADGVGGHAGGDVASWTVSHVLLTALATRPPGTVTEGDVRGALAAANARLAERARTEPGLTGMATTFTGLFCGTGAVHVVHVGDSRAYLLRDGTAVRVTTDDSPVQMLLESGAIDEAAARRHPLRHVLLRCLAGKPADAQDVAVHTVPARPGDRWLLTTDGLTDAVDEDAVVALLRAHADPERVADTLVDAARAAEARDDVTVLVCDVATGPPGERRYRLVGAAAAHDRMDRMDRTDRVEQVGRLDQGADAGAHSRHRA